MKVKLLLLAVAICSAIQLHAQDRSPFRSGYLRLGINKLGGDLDNALTPKENIFDGKFGASTGYVLEFGHIYYFKDRANTNGINYGLDWTILSLNYNKLDKWENYGVASGASNVYVDGAAIGVAASTKLGPTISFNPLEKLVIDVRFQIAPTFRVFDLEYSEEEEETTTRHFSFANYQQEEVDDNFDAESIKNRVAFGLCTSFGITVRRKAVGLSLDYLSGKVNSNYEAYDAKAGQTNGKEKIKANTLQLKLSLTL